MTTDILTFQQALDKANGKKHLFLGNGFSVACKPDIFSYQSLLEEANVSEELRGLFEKFSTQDFETIIQKLNDSSIVLNHYSNTSKEIIEKLDFAANELKSSLVSILCAKHPNYPHEIETEKYQSCASFLSYFNGGRLFTVNYDLLLYWTLINDLAGAKLIDSIDDGFRGTDHDYVAWSPADAKNQTIYHLHGALHLFDAGHELEKYTWLNTGIPLMDQIRKELEANKFPLFVAEGTSKEKITRIHHSDYLGKGLRSLVEITGNLFVFGHSLSSNDEHLFDLIVKSKIENIFFSVYGNPESKDNKQLIKIAKAMETKRMAISKKKLKPLSVHFYCAESANVWRDHSQ